MQPWVIALFVVLMLREALGGPALAVGGAIPAWGGWLACTAPMALLALVLHLALSALGRSIDRTGALRTVAASDRLALFGRVGIVMLHVVNVLVLGWFEIVRGAIGDIILIDELVAVAPPVLGAASIWWSQYPIERRVREAVLLRSLERSETVYPVPSRGAFVLWNFRHQTLLTLGPLALIVAWMDGVELLVAAARARGWGEEGAAAVSGAGQLLGIAGIFTVAPLLIRLIWDTASLGPGPTRDRLEGLCRRYAVRVRDILVWRTHGTMVNAAALGVVRPLRYILLSDALLDVMPTRQVEAVMAHEVAHMRLRHIPWMALVMLSIGAGISAIATASLIAAGLVQPAGFEGVSPASWAVDAAVSIGVLASALLVFGVVSRRFEWQADAFAARHLTLTQPLGDGLPSATITHSAAAEMTGALETVAMMNHVPRERPSWRHGSIARRQQKLRDLVGHPVDRLPIDVTVRWIKRGAAAVGVGAIVYFVGGSSL